MVDPCDFGLLTAGLVLNDELQQTIGRGVRAV
jgi:hypothetical protein